MHLLGMNDDSRSNAAQAFAAAIAAMPADHPVLLLGHFDADGLSGLAIVARALDRAGRRRDIRLVGKGENPWDAVVGKDVEAREPGGLVAIDLGVREGPIARGVPTILIDHHRPTGTPGDALVISGHALSPEPTSALLALWCAAGIAPVHDLLWLAALGLIGDMAPDDAFPELKEAQTRYGKTALRDAVSLINAPRRTASADATPALALLLESDGPKAIVKGDRSEVATLYAAKQEVAAELAQAKRAPPKVRDDIALIRFHSPCQIHPLIAQQWRGRLKDKIVLAANTGYRPGWVHFAARSATGRDLIEYLAAHRPPGADAHYGSGHAQATGGALRLPDWNRFVTDIGFPDQQVPL
jgi:single-stranded-DNA-specific exonuclease